MDTEETGAPGRGELGRLLLELRAAAGLSQEELAHAAGVSVRALADLERGRTRGPQRRTVQALAEALRLDAADAERLERTASLGRPRPRAEEPPPAHRNTLALPRDIGDFTARHRALDRLLVLAADPDPAHPPVVLVSGQPGLGKTTFAVHAAHHLAEHFPDGQYAVDLHGMGPEPTAPRDALARLLRALGTPEGALPAGTEDRAGLLRELTGGRRLLLLLDNAADEEQVRPLLPATGRSLTLVTSRHALAGLEAVHRVELGLLRREESVELLTRILGTDRVGREAQAARDLADRCGQLPLAVRIAGQRLVGRPHERLAKLAAQLAEQSSRLDLLKAGSLEVRAAFALSYQQLDEEARRVLRRASLAAGGDFGPETAALLADLPRARASRRADELVDAGLLQSDPAADRYRFHDLLRLFAREQVEAEDGPERAAAAQDRTDRWMLRRAAAAALFFDAEPRPAAAAEETRTDPDPASAPADREQARAWLEAEREQWLASLRRAAAAGRHRQVLDTAGAMHWFSDRNQHWELWPEVFGHSVGAARALGSRREEAVHLNYLAWAFNLCVFDYASGQAAADAALAVARELGDRQQCGWALGYSAGALHHLGRIEESHERLREAAVHLGADPSPQSKLGELTVLNTLGTGLRHAGRAAEALEIHRRTEAICRAGLPGQPDELVGLYLAVARQQIGSDLAALGRWAEAEEPLRFALARFEAARMRSWSEPARLDLGLVLAELGPTGEAWQLLLDARDSLVELNSPRRQEAVDALRGLADRSGA
ncbi:ATP-binding protein [Kitasatospora terrestris]|uniref:XRE family transcriptional regulator n=1 Tax=Kitasatospora terrestris TaxID=258051 RepID=A0ABP9DL62_9ACTN